MRFGFTPRVRPPDINPIEKPTASSTASLAEPRLRSFRVSRVSRPCFRLAVLALSFPASVRGPVDSPPCVRQTALPFIAGALHLCRLRFDIA